MPRVDRIGARLKREERRAQIIRIAREVFANQGFHNASMDGIAEEAGVSKPVLYQHFVGKFQLYLAVLEDTIQELVNRLREGHEHAAQGLERINNLVETTFDFVSTPGTGARLLFQSDLLSENEIRSRIEAMDAMVADEFTAALLEECDIRPEEARMTSNLVCGLPRLAAGYWLANSEGLEREQAVSLTTRLMWEGVDTFAPKKEH